MLFRSINTTSINIKNEIIKAYSELKGIELKELIEKRYDKFRNMGEYIGG